MGGCLHFGEVGGEDDAFNRQIERDHRHREQGGRAQQMVMPDEDDTFPGAPPKAGRLPGMRRFVRSGKPDTGNRDHGKDETGAREPERVDRADRGDEQAAQTGPDEVGAVEYRLVDAVDAVQTETGGPCRFREHCFAGGDPGGIEDRTERGQDREAGNRQAEGGIDHRNRHHRDGGEGVGGDGDTAATGDVDDRAREEAGEEERNCGGRRHESGTGRAAGAFQDQPGQGDDRDAIADASQQRACREQQERCQVGGSGWWRDDGCSQWSLSSRWAAERESSGDYS